MTYFSIDYGIYAVVITLSVSHGVGFSLAERIKRNGKLNQGQFFRIFKTQNIKEFQLEF